MTHPDRTPEQENRLVNDARRNAHLYWIAMGLGSAETAAVLKQRYLKAVDQLGYNPLPEKERPC